MHSRDVLCGVWLALLLWTVSAAAQQTVTVVWNANVDPPLPDGYLLAYGSQPGATGAQIDAGAAIQLPVTLPVGTWYLRVYAYIGPQFSGPSNEVSWTVAGAPPPVDVCLTTPLVVTVTQWPARKVPLLYTASQPIVSVQYVKQKRIVVGAIFVDDRGCALTVMR